KMLTTLKSEPDLVSHFMKYVIAASHPKITRRFRSSSSKEYLGCFKSVKLEDTSESESFPFQSASKRERVRIELENDRRFLIILGKGRVVSDYEERFPKIANIFKEPPNLKDKTSPDETSPGETSRVETSPDDTFELFNSTTGKEYHSLFMV